jgi:Kelch motif
MNAFRMRYIISKVAFFLLMSLFVGSNAGAGGFVPTGAMTRPRGEHRSIVLKDGRVLIIGGGSPFGVSYTDATAEVYDPTTGTFTSTGSMNIARLGGTAVLLQSGKVLVFGGGESCYYYPSEIYDPSSGAWTETGSDPYRLDARYQTGTLLPDGTVLATGGWDYQDVGVSEAVCSTIHDRTIHRCRAT